ncbi:MAG: peptidase T [Treponema sp.]|jgi:tripeptide aminopeptidase|nr:peptidase T [Treponema sp.]
MENPVKQIEDRLLEKLLVSRFMRYVRYWTESDRHLAETPSSPGQWELAKALRDELLGLGLADVELTDHCYVIARLPPSPGKEAAPSIGFLAHIDTSSDVSGKDVKPQLVHCYNGEKIVLADGLALDPAQEPDLSAQKGRAIIHSDGSTLLGADDKAGVAEIMAAVEYLSGRPEIEHGPVEIIFSPDEETGKGLPDFPLEKIKSTACYTLDGGPMGEIEAECFNAWKADVQFRGKVVHVGAARGILANAALMAASFAVMLPRSESPEATDGYYGYYCPMEIKGDLENAALEVYLRDFDTGGMKRRVAALEVFAKTVEAQFPGGKVIVKAEQQYYNMKSKIDKQPEALDRLKQALDTIGVEYHLKPIRGGTDGSRLTELGIPTPNIFTGGRNFHSRIEWVSVSEMCAACKLVIGLIRLWGE